MNDHPLKSTPGCLDDIIAGYLEATACGQVPDRTALLAAHLDLADELRAFFADHDKMTQAAKPVRRALGDSPSTESFPQKFGDYELLEEIGRGGMGIVYKARQVSFNRIVALKRIRAGQLAVAGRSRTLSPRSRGGRRARSSAHRADLRSRRTWRVSTTSR